MSELIDPSQEKAVRERYAQAASKKEEALCCPVDYDDRYLKAIPSEVIEKDYGCGDPSKYLKAGETVLDLGSGTGKICFIASQVVGPSGRVIGVDMTDDMLEVARRNAPIVADRIGYANVAFRKGRIQDLKLDLAALEGELKAEPIEDANGFLNLESTTERLRRQSPLIADHSIDVVVSNCVLNLVESTQKKDLFQELFRVVVDGGRVVISDIVSDRPIPDSLKGDSKLWSGCLSGAFTEAAFLEAFAEAGFHGVRYLKFEDRPWQTIEGIEFRSVTVEAFKSVQSDAAPSEAIAIYSGPFKSVVLDDGREFRRGERIGVSESARLALEKSPYANSFVFVDSSNGSYNPCCSPVNFVGKSCC